MLAKNKYLNEFLGFPIHLVVAGVLCTITGFALEMVVLLPLSSLVEMVNLKPRFLPPPLFDIAFGPMAWGPAVLIGFWINKRMRQRSACWIGALFALVFLSLMAREVSGISRVPYYQQHTKGHYWEFEYEQLIAIKPSCGGDECLGKLLLTAPAVNGIAYSVGASLALRSRAGQTRK